MRFSCSHIFCSPCSRFIKRKFIKCPLDDFRFNTNLINEDLDLIEELKFRCKAHNQPIVYVCASHLELACRDCFLISHKNCGGSPVSSKLCKDKLNEINENISKKVERISYINAEKNLKTLNNFFSELDRIEAKIEKDLKLLELLGFYRSNKPVLELNLSNYTLSYSRVEHVQRKIRELNYLISEIKEHSQSLVRVDLSIKGIYSTLPSNNHIKLMSRVKTVKGPNLFCFSIVPNLQTEITITGVGLGAPCRENFLEVSTLGIYTTNRQSKEESCIMEGLFYYEISEIVTEIKLENPVKSAPGRDIRFTIVYTTEESQYHLFDTPFLQNMQFLDFEKNPLYTPLPLLYLLIS